MEIITYISEILMSSYLIASILNLTLTNKIFKLNFKLIQNKIGIILVFGLVLFYGILVIRLLLTLNVDNSFDDIRLPKFYLDLEYLLYDLMTISPLLAFVLNIINRLRIKKYTILITSLMFLPRTMSFLIVYLTSDVTLVTINRVYLNPILILFISGTVLYIILLSIEKLQTKKNKSI